MENLSILLLIFGMYIVGVLISIFIVAYINTHTDGKEIHAATCALSWLFVFVIIIVMLIVYPLALLYDKVYDKFLEHKN